MSLVSTLQIVGSDSAKLLAEADAFAASYGSNAYSDFIHKHGRRPDRVQAATIGRLLGRRVRADDGSLQPIPSKTARDAARATLRAREAEERIDAELSRAVDAISFLAQNEIDPSPLIARVSAMEAETITKGLEKAVEWLNRFATGWRQHVNIGNGEAEGYPAGHRGRVGPGQLRLVRSRD